MSAPRLSGAAYARLSAAERDELRTARYREATAAGLVADWNDALANMPTTEGGRNEYVHRVAVVAAIRASKVLGLNREKFINAITEAGGDCPLPPEEIGGIWDRAVERITPKDVEGLEAPEGGEDGTERAERQPEPWEREPTEDEREYVPRMITVGGDVACAVGTGLMAVLRALSPVAVPPELKRQAAAFIRTLYPDGRYYAYAGGKKDSRTRERMYDPVKLADDIERGVMPVPQYVSLNGHSGTAEGKNADGQPSYCLEKSVAAWRTALVEFDALPLDLQYLFWIGVLATGSLPVVAITHSGGKSLHGYIRLAAVEGDETRRVNECDRVVYLFVKPDGSEDRRYAKVPEPKYQPSSEAERANWGRLWGKVEYDAKTGKLSERKKPRWGELSRRLMSNPDAKYRSDGGNASALVVRLPGFPKHHEKKDGKWKPRGAVRLLYLAEPDYPARPFTPTDK